MDKRPFHIYLISDSTGETLEAVSRAALSQYDNVDVVERSFPMVRSEGRLRQIIFQEAKQRPGIVLYTIVDQNLADELAHICNVADLASFSVLDPIYRAFRSHLGEPSSHKAGAQHTLNENYFRSIEALNFTMLHDDGRVPDDINQADIVILGVSRSSKTPTSIYLANRGFKVVNIPIILGHETSFLHQEEPVRPLVVGLFATPERISIIRQQRALSGVIGTITDDYVDRQKISEEILFTKRLCARKGWPLIDVTRRSIEETAATIINLVKQLKPQIFTNHAAVETTR